MMHASNAPPPRHAVVALLDNQGTVQHVTVRRLDRPATWRKVWEHRMEIDTDLARWLRTLEEPPTERILVGSVGMSAPAARAVAAMVAGWFGKESRPSNVGRRGRPTGRIEADGTLRCWSSRAAAGRALGVSRWAVLNKVRAGKLLDFG